MKDQNQLSIIGRLTRDAEMKTTQGGFSITNFSIAVNRTKKTQSGYEDVASFFDVALYGKQAESITQYLTKGKQVAISGDIEQQRWESDGQNRSKVVINAYSVQLLGGEKKNSQAFDDF